MGSPSKRRHRRVHLQSDVTFRGVDIWQTCRAENISEGGIFLRSIPRDCVGTPVDLEFDIPNKELPVLAKGEVVWCENKGLEVAGCGVKFVRLYRMDRDLIQQFIAQAEEGRI